MVAKAKVEPQTPVTAVAPPQIDQVSLLIRQGVETCKVEGGYDIAKYTGKMREALGDQEYVVFEDALINSMQPQGFTGYVKATAAGKGVMPLVVATCQVVGAVTAIAFALEAVGAVFDIDQIRIVSFGARKLLGE